MRNTKVYLAWVVALTMLTCMWPQGAAQLNQNCVVSVLNRTVPVNADGTWVLPNIPANFGLVRARATCVNDGVTSFGQSDLFAVPANDSKDVPPIALGSTTPIPTSVTIASPGTQLITAGQTLQLAVSASYATGAPADITASASGTIYNDSNPAIATVSSDGLVTAVSSGTVVIQAVNEGRQGIVSLEVVLGSSHGGIPDSWALAHGLDPNDPTMPMQDPDHDGLTNLQEFMAGTDPMNPDTDGDGLTDGQEVLIYHTSPVLVSTDGSGIPDGIEVQTNTLGGSLSAKLAAAIRTLSVTPSHFALNVNTIQGIASQQLKVTALLIDGKTSLDLTSTSDGTTYTSSDLTICNFGTPDGNIFAGNSGACTITVANGPFSAQVPGVVTSFSPIPLSFVAIPGFANEVAVNGSYAFVAAGSAGLQVVDISNRNAPAVVASLALQGNADDIKFLADMAYVAAGSAGLEVIDLSKPLNPVLKGTFSAANNALTSVIRGTTAYVANGSTLVVVDVTNPAAMTQLGSFAINGATLLGMDVDAKRNLLVATAGTNGIYTIDVSNPAKPVLLGTTITGDARAVAIQGNYAYVADYQNGTMSVDISNPAIPVVASKVTDPNLGGTLQDIGLSQNFALAADVTFSTGIPITDISDPTNLISRNVINFPQRNDNGMGIAVDGAYAYLVTENVSQNKFGTTGDSRLYIGEYLALTDNKGIPPTAVITSPTAGSTLVEGATVPINVNATDDVAVAAVNFLINGNVAFTATSAPYQYNFVVPVGTGSLTIGATAVDFGGNVGTAPNVVVNVIPDPGTTVVGNVVNNNAPVAGATVSAPGGLTATTAADGSFSIPGVPTVSGPISVSASLTSNGVTLSGSSLAVPPVPGGTTNVGTIVISQAAFQTQFGTLIDQCDDCFQQVTLPFPFPYFGQTYTSIYVNNNGNLTFANGDSTYAPTIAGFVSQPRIGVFWDNLVGTGGLPGEGLYVNSSLPGLFIVTWLHQQIFCCTGDDTVQLIILNDGTFAFGYNGVSTITIPGSTSQAAIVGITSGGNAPLTQIDYLTNQFFTVTGPGSLLEVFSPSNPFNIDNSFIIFTPDGSGGYFGTFIPFPPGSYPLAVGAGRRGVATPSTFTLQGHAYNADGGPLVGAVVSVNSSLALPFHGTARTDASGYYSLPGVPYGGVGVIAKVGGRAVSVGGAVVRSGSDGVIDLRPPPRVTKVQQAQPSARPNGGPLPVPSSQQQSGQSARP